MLTVNKAHIGECVILRVVGRVDAINAPLLQRELEQLVADGFGDHLLVNLAGVNYLSAAGLRVLKWIETTTGQVAIAEPSDRVREVMQITGLNRVYRLFASENDALHHTNPLVNAYTRLEHGSLADRCPDIRGMPYSDWFQQYQRQQAQLMDEKTIITSIEAGIAHLQSVGITTVGDVSATGLSIAPLMKANMHGVVYILLQGRDPDQVDELLIQARGIIDKWRPQLTGGLRLGLALPALHAVHPALVRATLDYATSADLPLSVAVAGSQAEVDYLRDGTGALAAYYADAPPIDIPHQSPIAYLEALGVLAHQPSLRHAVHIDADDIERIQRAGATIIHTPRRDLRLTSERLPLASVLDAGIRVRLGTGSRASAPTLSILDELESAVALHHGQVAPARLVQMIHGKLT